MIVESRLQPVVIRISRCMPRQARAEPGGTAMAAGRWLRLPRVQFGRASLSTVGEIYDASALLNSCY